MLSPDYLYHVSDRAIELYEKLNRFVVSDICRRLVSADWQFTGSIDWQLYKMQQSGMLMDDIVSEVAMITKKSEQEIAEIFKEASYKSQSYDNEVYKKAGLVPIDINQSPAMLKILQATYVQTLGEIKNFTRTTASTGQRIFLETMDDVYFRVISGQQSYTEAIRQAINAVSSAGVVITYPTGHKDTIETAVRRCVLTGVGQATARVSLQNAEELGTDLVLVSSHFGARPEHAEWQGKVYSISGNSKKYRKLSEETGYGTVTGLCGANCRHHFMPYIDGVSTNPYEKFDSEENQKRYDNLQEQRRQERGIRSTKRELQAMKESIEATKDDKLKLALQQDYDRKSARLKAQRAAYDEFSQKADLPTHAERLQVAGWGNSSASSARAAARRYEESLGTSLHDTTDKWAKEAKEELLLDERSLISREKETAIVYSSDGKFLFQKRGTVDTVNFTKSEIKKMSGCIVSHNHPSGGSFSADDIALLANSKIAELRAITASGVYYMRRPSKWPKDVITLEDIKKARNKLATDIKRKYNLLYKQGKITKTERFWYTSHEVNKRFSEKYGIEYGKDIFDE